MSRGIPAPAFARRLWSWGARGPGALWWVGTGAWTLTIFLLSSGPVDGPDGPDWLPMDKVLHFGAFGLLASLALAGAARSWPAAGAALRGALVVAAVSAYGASDEVHQMFVAERSPDVLDWVADTLGAVVAALAWPLVASWLSESSE